MLTLGLFSYAATWGTVAFLLPTEIFPSDLRAQGNGFGITGWAIGVGMTTLVNPIMFETMTVSCISDPVIDEADLYRTEPHLLPLRCSQLDLDPHHLPLYVDATTKDIDGPELIMVIVYPETRNRSLESIEALFSTPSPFYWKMEQAYKLHGDVLVEHKVNKSDGLDASQNESISYEKPEVQTIA
jgi:hypothetical protein